MVKKILALLLVLSSAGFVWRQSGDIRRAPGVLAPKDPQQTNFTTPQPPIQKDGWTLQPLAAYRIEARVLSKTHYSGDDVSTLSPYDLALGWGRMSDSAVLDHLTITQSNRFSRWECFGDTPIPESELVSHSANNHLIPADDAIKDKIAALRPGSLVKISGYLVEANHPQADHSWRSSLTRDDSGEGACEIIYVREISEVAAD
jgi:hypothetical protein